MKRRVSGLKLFGILVALFVVGVLAGFGYDWSRGSIKLTPFFTSAGNLAAVEGGGPEIGSAPPINLAARPGIPTPRPSPPITENPPSSAPAVSPPPASANVAVLKPAVPQAKNELKLPRVTQPQPVDELPVVVGGGQTIWVPKAIEGCWKGRGDARLEYLGGCPNMFSGTTSPVTLRWCFRRIGNEPLHLVTARGKYGQRVRQTWEVTAAHGQTIDLRETISYDTMLFLHVVDVGRWTCTITPNDQLACREHELARCGPGGIMQAPWFSGSGWITARRERGVH